MLRNFQPWPNTTPYLLVLNEVLSLNAQEFSESFDLFHELVSSMKS